MAIEQFAMPYEVPKKEIASLDSVPGLELRESKEFVVLQGPEFNLFFDKEPWQNHVLQIS